MKSGDGSEDSLIEPVTYQCCWSKIVGIQYYWSKIVVDTAGWQKSFFEDMIDLYIFDPSEPTLLCCIRFCFMTIWLVLTLQKTTNLLILPVLYPLTSLMSLMGLINENNMEYNNMQLDASSAIDLHLYLLSKIEEYSQTTLDEFHFASIKFCDLCIFLPSCKTKYTRHYTRFVLTKSDTREMKIFLMRNSSSGKDLGKLKEKNYLCSYTF